MNSVLVTGATGFVGRHLVPALRRRGFSVLEHSALDGDIARCKLPGPASLVYHLAGRTYVPASWREPQSFYEVNFLGTANVLEYCRSQGAAMVFISSYVYGHPQRLPIPEDHPVAAVNPYAHSKVLAEDVCRFYQSHFGVPVDILRPFNLYGPGQDPQFVIASLIGQALSAESAEISVADFRPRRDYIFIDDFIDLLLRVGQGAGEVYNAGSGKSYSVAEVVDIINAIAPCPKPLVSRDQERANEIMEVVADITKARAKLGWEPRTALREGLARTMEAMRRSAGN